MLTTMRKGASGWIAKILFALLIVSFLPLVSDGLHEWLFQKIQSGG